MKKKIYQRPELEVIYVETYSLMEAWSIPIDNDDPGIGPGDEGDIGAKRGSFDYDWGQSGFKPWEE